MAGRNEADTTLIVLAGGQGSRMGRPKAELRINNAPILAALLDRWNWPGPTLLVTAPGREHPAGSVRFDHETTDPIAGAGPLRGLLTGLENLQSPLAICAAVDMPALTRQQLDWILQALIDNKTSLGVMCERLASGEKIIEPFPSAYRKEALGPVGGWLSQGRRSMHSLLKLAGFLSLPAPAWDDAVWTNLNSPSEFERYSAGANPARMNEGNDL